MKRSASATEAVFYRTVAGPLQDVGLSTPVLLDLLEDGPSAWLLLENVPDPRPPLTQGPPDQRIVRILASLHAATRAMHITVPEGPHEPWTAARTARALTFFTPDERTALKPLLHTLQERAQRLAEPWCWLSGDPNPLNWASAVTAAWCSTIGSSSSAACRRRTSPLSFLAW